MPLIDLVCYGCKVGCSESVNHKNPAENPENDLHLDEDPTDV